MTLHRAPLPVVCVFCGMHHCHPCDIDVSKSKAGLHIRLPAEQVLVSGWEMVPDFHGLILQHLIAVFPGHGTVERHVPGVYIPLRAGGSHFVHCLHVNVVPLCVAA